MDNKMKIIKMAGILVTLALVVWLLAMFHRQSQKSLADYATENPALQNQNAMSTESSEEDLNETLASPDPSSDDPVKDNTDQGLTIDSEDLSSDAQDPSADVTDGSKTTQLPGLSLNGSSMISFRKSLNDDFYYEPLSDLLRDHITGTSYPDEDGLKAMGKSKLEISYDNLCYMHLLHYDFNGEVTEGEMICNLKIADDLMEIFYELYENEYQVEKIRLIDEYDGDDNASMTDNNTSCFNYRTVDNSTSLSKHALGLAIDVNPLYNPYITYNKDGTENCSPENGIDYADRSKSFPYKIDENDLCYKLFKKHGFTWGGNWNSVKDYQHFQKTK